MIDSITSFFSSLWDGISVIIGPIMFFVIPFVIFAIGYAVVNYFDKKNNKIEGVGINVIMIFALVIGVFDIMGLSYYIFSFDFAKKVLNYSYNFASNIRLLFLIPEIIILLVCFLIQAGIKEIRKTRIISTLTNAWNTYQINYSTYVSKKNTIDDATKGSMVRQLSDKFAELGRASDNDVYDLIDHSAYNTINNEFEKVRAAIKHELSIKLPGYATKGSGIDELDKGLMSELEDDRWIYQMAINQLVDSGEIVRWGPKQENVYESKRKDRNDDNILETVEYDFDDL